MKKLPLVLLLTCSTMLIACSGEKINAHSDKTAYRSVKMIKNRLQPEIRVEYEMSFWMIRDANKDDAAFLAAVDGKKAVEIIGMGKEIYQKLKTEGFAEYLDQGKSKSDIKEKISDPTSGNRDVIYSM